MEALAKTVITWCIITCRINSSSGIKIDSNDEHIKTGKPKVLYLLFTTSIDHELGSKIRPKYVALHGRFRLGNGQWQDSLVEGGAVAANSIRISRHQD